MVGLEDIYPPPRCSCFLGVMMCGFLSPPCRPIHLTNPYPLFPFPIFCVTKISCCKTNLERRFMIEVEFILILGSLSCLFWGMCGCLETRFFTFIFFRMPLRIRTKRVNRRVDLSTKVPNNSSARQKMQAQLPIYHITL